MNCRSKSTNISHMSVVGHGIDIVEVRKISRLIDDPASHFLTRCFTDAERLDAGDGPNRVVRLAGRFAAKEAILKALGVGFGDGIAFTDVEIQTLDSGEPHVVLHRRVAAIAEERGISKWLVSTSHSSTAAVASALALGGIS